MDQVGLGEVGPEIYSFRLLGIPLGFIPMGLDAPWA